MKQKSERKSVSTDKEWIDLIITAKQMGVTISDVRDFLKEPLQNSVTTPDHSSIMEA